MKNGMYVALICLAIIPAYSHDAANRVRPANEKPAATPVQDYADRVNGLLRDVHATLREISERAEAGDLTPQQAQRLKLATTRSMIARLETISAVYDAKVASRGGHDDVIGLADNGASTRDALARASLRADSTVSVEELKRESSK